MKQDKVLYWYKYKIKMEKWYQITSYPEDQPNQDGQKH